MTDIYYIARKLVGPEQARHIVGLCLDTLQVLPVDHSALVQALARPEREFEDAVQIAAAMSAGADSIVTRDRSGFAQSPVRVSTPNNLLEYLNSRQA